MENLATQIKADTTINSHYVTHTHSSCEVGRITTYLCFTTEVCVPNTIVFHFELEHAIHIWKLETSNKNPIWQKTEAV